VKKEGKDGRQEEMEWKRKALIWKKDG